MRLTLHAALGPALALVAIGSNALAQLPPVPTPPENPFTAEKAVLGKMLFWDEQLSSDNTIACGTCHLPANAGSDPRLGPHPGPDGLFGNGDDLLGSPGVARTDPADDYQPDPAFGFGVQVTGRSAQSVIGSQWAPEAFWDGRAGGEFLDPANGSVSIVSGGALEDQVVGPPVSDVEMAHEARSWDQITAKLEHVDPLWLATNLPGDIVSALSGGATYPELFDDAFGTPEITAERIALVGLVSPAGAQLGPPVVQYRGKFATTRGRTRPSPHRQRPLGPTPSRGEAIAAPYRGIGPHDGVRRSVSPR